MRVTTKKEVPPEKVREMILAAYRSIFRTPGASHNRAKSVADKMGIHVSKLYSQIEELGLKGEIAKIREEAGISSSGRGEGARYKCSACGGADHNARSPKCRYYEAPP